jgi:hypothetical protein
MTSLNLLDIALIILSSLFAITSTMLLISTAKREKQVRQLTLDKAILITEFAKVIEKQSNQSIEETEGFLKFVSDSRDWAFTYIEDVQQAIQAYDVALSTDDAAVINIAYKKLISFLPDEDLV